MLGVVGSNPITRSTSLRHFPKVPIDKGLQKRYDAIRCQWEISGIFRLKRGCSVATVWQRPESKTWYVLHGRQKIRVGKSRRAAQHLADKIDVALAEKKVGIVTKLTQQKKAQSIGKGIYGLLKRLAARRK